MLVTSAGEQARRGPPRRLLRRRRRRSSRRGVEQRCSTRGAKGIVLDLRGNGGGLLDEAVLRGEHLHPQGHDRLAPTARTRPRQVFNADGRRDLGQDPARRCSSTSGTASRGRDRRPARSQDRDRAHVVGTRTFGKGVFQEVEPALQRRRARHHRRRSTSPRTARTSAAAGVRRGAGITPNVRRRQPPRTPRGRGAARRALGRLAARSQRASDAAPARGADVPSSACSRSAARFLVGEPFFERGRAPRRSTARPARRARRRPRAAARPAARRPRRRSCAGIGRPDVARDVIEALMLDRGLRAPLRPGGRAGGARRPAGRRRRRRRAATCATCRRSRSTRPRARDFDDAISAERARRTALARVGAHRRRQRLRARPARASTARRYRRAHERVRPRRGRADAARGALERAPARSCRARTASR